MPRVCLSLESLTFYAFFFFLSVFLSVVSTRLFILHWFYLFIFPFFSLSFTELSSEIKALDLRLSDTLLHNLIKIGDLVAPQSDALRIMSMVMKDVSPKWRMMFIRKLFQAENAHLVLPSLPLFIHNFGPICHPLVKELLSDENMNTEASRQLSKVSSLLLKRRGDWYVPIPKNLRPKISYAYFQ